MSDGAERALYGYRYQMLCAVGEAMDLHTANPTNRGWSITIEDSQAEKADYSVTVAGRVIRAVQVKTSLPSTPRPRPLTAAPCAEIFEELTVAFPCADEIVIRTNLPVSYTPASGSRPSRRIHQEQETTTTLTQRLINRLSELRRLQGLPSDPASTAALLAVLVDHAHRLAHQPAQREWDHSTFRQQVGLSGRNLAKVLGRSTWSQYWDVPHGSPIDRPDVLNSIREQLPWSTLTPEDPPPVLALTGLSGIGKSTLAAQWAREGYYAYALTFWLPADSEAALAEAVRRMMTIEVPEAADWDIDHLRHQWRQLLQRTPLTWLVICDGVTNPASIVDWLPTAGLGHVLITTTDSAISPSLATPLPVPALGAHEALTLLTTRLRLEPSPTSAPEFQHLQELVALLGHWPLAIEMAAAWLSATGRTPIMTPEYMRRIRDTVTHQQQFSPPNHPRTVAAAVIVALDDLSESAYGLLKMCALLGGDLVPSGLVAQCLRWEPFLLDSAVVELRRSSLINRAVISPAPAPELAEEMSMNQLVRHLTLERPPADDEKLLVGHERLATMAQDFLDQENLPAVYRLAPCVARLIDASQNGSASSQELLTAIGNVAQAMGYRGDHNLAIDWLMIENHYLIALLRNEDTPSAQRSVAYGMQIKTEASLCGLLARAHRLQDALSIAALAVPRCLAFWKATGGNSQLETPLTQFVAVLRRLEREGTVVAEKPTPMELLAQLTDAIPERLLKPDPAEDALNAGEYETALAATLSAYENPQPTVAHVEGLKRHAEAAAANGERDRAIAALSTLARQTKVLELGPDHLSGACLAAARATAGSLLLMPTHPTEDTRSIGSDIHSMLNLAPPVQSPADQALALILRCLAETARGTARTELHTSAWAQLSHLTDPLLALALLWARGRRLGETIGGPLHQARTLGRSDDALVLVVPEETFKSPPVPGLWPVIRHDGFGLAVAVPTTTEPVTVWVDLNLDPNLTQIVLNTQNAGGKAFTRLIVISSDDSNAASTVTGRPELRVGRTHVEGRVPALRLDPDLASLHEAGHWGPEAVLR